MRITSYQSIFERDLRSSVWPCQLHSPIVQKGKFYRQQSNGRRVELQERGGPEQRGTKAEGLTKWKGPCWCWCFQDQDAARQQGLLQDCLQDTLRTNYHISSCLLIRDIGECAVHCGCTSTQGRKAHLSWDSGLAHDVEEGRLHRER